LYPSRLVGVSAKLRRAEEQLDLAQQDWHCRGPADSGAVVQHRWGCTRPDRTDVRLGRDDWPMPLRVLGSAAGEFRDVLRAATATHRRLRDHLMTIIVVTVGIDLLCAIAAFLLERHSPQTEIGTFGSAAFWTTTQLLTVSSQIKNPISTGGRILDVFMEIYAITVIAALAGAFGSFLQKRGQEIDGKR
jgi:hypothetical protein